MTSHEKDLADGIMMIRPAKTESSAGFKAFRAGYCIDAAATVQNRLCYLYKLDSRPF